MKFDYYASGVLHPEQHERLVANIEARARDAGIPPHWIAEPMLKYAGDTEVEYMRDFRRQLHGGVYGLCYAGDDFEISVDDRMSAMTGCFVRNNVRARVMTLRDVLDDFEAGTLDDLECILIPNFFRPKSDGGSIPLFRIALLNDLMLKRKMGGKQTVIHVSDPAKLASDYSTSIARFVSANFMKVEA